MAISMTLNDEQRKLVEDNHALIPWYIKRRNLDFDDWYDILALSLCKAAFYYDESKGSTFSSFATRCMDCDVHIEMRCRSRRIESSEDILSLDFEYCDDDGDCYDFSELIPDITSDTESYVISKITIDNLNKHLDNRSKYIIGMLSAGRNQATIARNLGISRQRCSVLIGKLKEQYISLFA